MESRVSTERNLCEFVFWGNKIGFTKYNTVKETGNEMSYQASNWNCIKNVIS